MSDTDVNTSIICSFHIKTSVFVSLCCVGVSWIVTGRKVTSSLVVPAGLSDCDFGNWKCFRLDTGTGNIEVQMHSFKVVSVGMIVF